MKYWEYSDEELIEKKMYPLIPLQLFNLRKGLEKVHNKKDIEKIKEISFIAKELANKLAKESAVLFEEDEILGEDFHKMLLAIQNLIEYLNRNYINDDNIEKEVSTMTKTLYDPEVERRGVEKWIEKGVKEGKTQAAINFLKLGLDEETVAKGTGLTIDKIKELRKSYNI